jgi:frataxin-like iron-binding protein CyaY
MVDMSPVKSSNIESVGYDAEGSRLHVKFKNGGEYIYHGIEPAQHAELMAADSAGSHLHKVIKPSAVVTKVETT